MSVVDRIDHFQRRHPVLGFPLGVIYKYFDDIGPYLSALIAYYAFISLFPLLLLFTTVLGWVLRDSPEWQERLIKTAFRQLPVIGEQLQTPEKISGSLAGIAIGLVGSIYGGLGVAQAIQYALNTIWGVPRNSRPNPFASRGRSFLLLLTGGLALIVTTAVSTFLSTLPTNVGTVKWLTILVTIALNWGLATFVFWLAIGADVPARKLWRGALLMAVLWQVLQAFGLIYVQRVIASLGGANGVFAIVLGLIAFLHLTAILVVLCAEVDLVWEKKLYPRALLTPFTDDVDLTEADQRSYEALVRTQRLKGQEFIDVEFGDRPSRVRRALKAQQALQDSEQRPPDSDQ